METTPLTPGNFYHIYNRGVNKENIFREERNYHYFLEQYRHYCSAVFETYAYALLKNHFHLLVCVTEAKPVTRKDGKGLYQPEASRQLSHFFNSYAQSINKAYNRTGQLFESPFHRKEITNDAAITSVIYYCHFNAQRHGFVSDFRNWPHSSYAAICKGQHSWLAVEKVLDWFGGVQQFEKAHTVMLNNSLHPDWWGE
ncbi:MAG: transposase [Lacibacter sp.]|jgi:hypothetical protein